MENKQFGLIVFSISFGIASFIFAVLFMTISKDLSKKIVMYEEYIKELEWENSQTVMYCECDKQ